MNWGYFCVAFGSFVILTVPFIGLGDYEDPGAACFIIFIIGALILSAGIGLS